MNKPKVSIGITVYNAETFLEQTLNSLLAQTFDEIEFCISDNASTDGSEELCRALASHDDRIRYFRQESNQGSIRNWNNVLSMATGEYFVWAADHDLWKPDAIEQYVQHLDENPDTVLVHSDAEYVDADNETMDAAVAAPIDTNGISTVRAFRQILWNLKRCNAIYGMFRRDFLNRIGGFPICWAMDIPLLTTTSLYGCICQLPEPLFVRRENRVDSLSHNSTATRHFHLTQLDPLSTDRFAGIENPYQTTCKAQLNLLKQAPVNGLTRKYLTWQVRMAYRARWNVRSRGWEFASRLVPKSIKRSRLVRS